MKGRRFVVLFTAVTAAARIAGGATLYVDADAGGANDGTSWSNAFTSLQSALGTATHDDEIWVAEGTYKPASTNRSASFVLSHPGLNLYGGFAGNEGSPNERNWTNHVTVLSGDIGSPGVKTDNSYEIVSATGADGAVVDGFTITLAYGTSSTNYGGGLHSLSAITINNCVFRDNVAYYGGALDLHADAVISNCAFYGNQAVAYGGAINIDGAGSAQTLVNCVLSHNACGGQGGGIRAFDCALTLMHCSFSDNSALSSGRALYLSSDAGASITNSILWDAGGSGGGIVIRTRTPSAYGATVAYSDIRGGFTPLPGYGSGTNNIDDDPLFLDETAGDLHLNPLSPCIDAATPSSAPDRDFDGSPRPQGDGYDMGAYEAAFVGPKSLLTLLSDPAGLTVSVDGRTAAAPHAFIVFDGLHTVSTPTPQSAAAGAQYLFDHWSDAGAATHEIVVTQDVTLTAVFVTQYLWTASAFPWGAGHVTPEAGWHNAGTTFTATAAASSTWSFVAWKGDTNGCTANSNELGVVMDQPRSVTASFVRAFPTSTWAFVATGDGRGASLQNQINTNVMREIADSVVAEQAEWVIFTGDLVYSGSPAAFAQWLNLMGPVYAAGIGVYPVRGNHDLGVGWTDAFGYLPSNGPSGEVGVTFSFTNRESLFIALDHYVTLSRVNQPWLDAQLQSNALPHVFAYGHEPAFAVYHKDCLDDYPAQRADFWNSLRYAGVKLYFAGHDHFYDHARIDDGDGNPANDLHQFIVGAAGAPNHVDPGGYYGNNGPWTPLRQAHADAWGYAVVEVSGRDVTITFKQRMAPGAYVPMDVLTYTAPLGLTLTVPAGVVEGQGVLTNAGAIHLAQAAATNLSVALSCDDTNRLTVPNAVIVPSGEIEAAFDVTVVDDALLLGPKTVVVTAGAPDYTDARAETTVEDNDYPIRYAAVAGASRFPFATWADAATNIQDAVDAAIDGQTVLVSNGTYAVDAAIRVGSGIAVRSLQTSAFTTVDGGFSIPCFSLAHSNAIIDGFTIVNGFGADGGGIFCAQPASILNCIVADSAATNDGAGIYCATGAVVRNCAIYGNSADGDGGGIFSAGGRLAVENCTVTSNRATGGCGGIRVGEAGFGAVRNTILRFNDATEYAGPVAFTNCFAMPDPPGSNNSTNDPAFVSLTNRDFHLRQDSPCVDAGADLPDIAADLDGIPRPLDGNNDGTAQWDAGVYEFVHPEADTDHDGMSDAWEMAYGLNPQLGDATGDLDLDRSPNYSEFIAGTSPTNPDDYLGILDCYLGTESNDVVIVWNTVSGRLYTVRSSTNLLSPAWTTVPDPAYLRIPGEGAPINYTNEDPGDRFLRIRVEKE